MTIVKYPDIPKMVSNALTQACYSDPAMKTMTIDFVFYLSRYYLKDLKAA